MILTFHEISKIFRVLWENDNTFCFFFLPCGKKNRIFDTLASVDLQTMTKSADPSVGVREQLHCFFFARRRLGGGGRRARALNRALVSVILWLDMAGLCQLHHSSATLFTGSGTTAKLESGAFSSQARARPVGGSGVSHNIISTNMGT